MASNDFNFSGDSNIQSGQTANRLACGLNWKAHPKPECLGHSGILYVSGFPKTSRQYLGPQGSPAIIAEKLRIVLLFDVRRAMPTSTQRLNDHFCRLSWAILRPYVLEVPEAPYVHARHTWRIGGVPSQSLTSIGSNCILSIHVDRCSSERWLPLLTIQDQRKLII